MPKNSYLKTIIALQIRSFRTNDRYRYWRHCFQIPVMRITRCNNVFYERIQSIAPTIPEVRRVYHHVSLSLYTMTHRHLPVVVRSTSLFAHARITHIYTWTRTRKGIPHRGKPVGQKRSFGVDRFPRWLCLSIRRKLQHKMPEFTSSGWQLRIRSRSDTRRIFSYYFTIGFHRCNVVERYVV